MSFNLAASMASSKRVGRFYVPQGVGGGGETPLAQMPMATSYEITGYSGAAYDGVNAISVSSVVRVGPIVDPNGSGRDCIIRRVVGTSGSSSVPSQRSEDLWIDRVSEPICNLTPGGARTYAFAFLRKVGESASASALDDAMLPFQTHAAMYGDTQPDLMLQISRQTNNMRWRAAGNDAAPGNYADNGGSGTNNWQVVGTNPWLDSGTTLAAEGVWVKCIVEHTPGYLVGHNPLINILMQVGNGAWVQTVTDFTGINTYNAGGVANQISYPRIGLYKHNGSHWNDNSLAFVMTPLYGEMGLGLRERAKACFEGLV